MSLQSAFPEKNPGDHSYSRIMILVRGQALSGFASLNKYVMHRAVEYTLVILISAVSVIPYTLKIRGPK